MFSRPERFSGNCGTGQLFMDLEDSLWIWANICGAGRLFVELEDFL